MCTHKHIYVYGIAFGARNAAITSGIHQFFIGRSKKGPRKSVGASAPNNLTVKLPPPDFF